MGHVQAGFLKHGCLWRIRPQATRKTFTDSLGLLTVGFSARILEQLKKLWPQKESRVEDAFFLFHLFVMVGSQQPVWSTSIQEGHLEVFVFSWSFMLQAQAEGKLYLLFPLDLPKNVFYILRVHYDDPLNFRFSFYL